MENSRATTKKGKQSIIDILRKETKRNHKKCSVKTTEDRKRMEDENGNKEQGQQAENTNEYDKYYHLEC